MASLRRAPTLGCTPNEEIYQMVEAIKADFLASGGNLADFDDETIRLQVLSRLSGESFDDDDGKCYGGPGMPPMASVEEVQETVRASPYLAALASRAAPRSHQEENLSHFEFESMGGASGPPPRFNMFESMGGAPGPPPPRSSMFETMGGAPGPPPPRINESESMGGAESPVPSDYDESESTGGAPVPLSSPFFESMGGAPGPAPSRVMSSIPNIGIIPGSLPT